MRELHLQLINDSATARRLLLLNILEQGKIVTTAYLANKTNVSLRTISTDIHALKRHFGESVQFISNYNGYSFRELDSDLYHKKKQALWMNEPIYEVISNIFYGDLDNIAITADYLHYSPGSLRRILTSIKPILRTYGIKLQMNPINITGDESSIRKFFLDFYYTGSQNFLNLLPTHGFHEKLLELLTQFITSSEISTDTSLTYFCYTIHVVVERYRQGHTVSLPSKLKTLIYKEKDFHQLYELLEELGKLYDFQLPKTEVAWIHYTLLTKRPILEPESEVLFYQRFGQWSEIESLSSALIASGDYDKWDQSVLNIFFKSFFLTKKINDVICPSLNRVMTDTLSTVKTSHATAFKNYLSFLKKNESKICFSPYFLEDIAVDLTLFCDILAINHTPKKNVCLLLEGDYMTIQAIKAQAIQWLGKCHNLSFLPAWSLNDSQVFMQDIDLFITNYQPYAAKYLDGKQHILTSPTIHLHDWKNIFNTLSISWTHLIQS